MTIRRFFCENICDDSALVVGQEHKHLSNVLRCKVGEKVLLWCGNGLDYLAAIQNICKDQTTLKVLSSTKNKAELDQQIVLYLGLLKNTDRYDFAVQKCVELGVSRIVPFVSQNTVAKKVNTLRLNAIALNAVKQCGRSRLVTVDETVNFAHVLQDMRTNPEVLFAYEKSQIPLRFALQSKKLVNAKVVSVVVGSEGGFCEDEILQVYDSTIVPIGLGNRILRSETAAIAILSLLTIGV